LFCEGRKTGQRGESGSGCEAGATDGVAIAPRPGRARRCPRGLGTQQKGSFGSPPSRGWRTTSTSHAGWRAARCSRPAN